MCQCWGAYGLLITEQWDDDHISKLNLDEPITSVYKTLAWTQYVLIGTDGTTTVKNTLVLNDDHVHKLCFLDDSPINCMENSGNNKKITFYQSHFLNITFQYKNIHTYFYNIFTYEKLVILFINILHLNNI